MASLLQMQKPWTVFFILLLLPVACISQEVPSTNREPLELTQMMGFMIEGIVKWLESLVKDDLSPYVGIIKSMVNSYVPTLDKLGTSAIFDILGFVHDYVRQAQVTVIPRVSTLFSVGTTFALNRLEEAEETLHQIKNRLLPLQGPR